VSDPTLLTVFVVLTAAAVLIQTGLIIGVYVVSLSAGRRADRAMDVAHTLLQMTQTAVSGLQAALSATGKKPVR
jgi:hypothetical protein